jgi:adenylate cyclase
MLDLINRILEDGRNNDDLGAILEKFSEWLVARGIPVCRTSLNMPTIDPVAAVLSFQWSREKGVARSTTAPEDAGGAQFQRSPISYLIERNLSAQRWKLEDQEVVGRFPLFQELRALGITEYCPAARTVQQRPYRSRGRGALHGDRPSGGLWRRRDRGDRAHPPAA